AMQLPLEPIDEPARVLVADDAAASRALAKHLLSAAGYEVVLAEDGAQAWQLLQVESFDVVVLDALMPGPNGFELLRRSRPPAEIADVPVILNTALSEAERGRGVEAGANAYVCKAREDSGRQLVACVDELLGKVGDARGESA